MIVFNFSDQYLLHFEEINDFNDEFLISGVSWTVFLYHIIILYYINFDVFIYTSSGALDL